MFVCEKCGSIYFQRKPEVCTCGSSLIENVVTTDISEYVCENCKSQYRKLVDKCENCGSKEIKCVTSKQITSFGPAKDYSISIDTTSVSSLLIFLLYSIVIVLILFLIIIIAFFLFAGIPGLIRANHMALTNDVIAYKEEFKNTLIMEAVMIPILGIFIFGIISYLKSKKNYHKILSKKEGDWILIKNIDYELMPKKTIGGIKYKILAKLITIGDKTIIKSSKELFVNPQGEFDLLIDLNDMDNYLIGKNLVLK